MPRSLNFTKMVAFLEKIAKLRTAFWMKQLNAWPLLILLVAIIFIIIWLKP